ncbi:MAG: hypothetical protein AAGG38_02055 [Planctomycetota bacterium]
MKYLWRLLFWIIDRSSVKAEIAATYLPEDLFDQDVLDDWATERGYLIDDELDDWAHENGYRLLDDYRDEIYRRPHFY